jgi:hypothetical protein
MTRINIKKNLLLIIFGFIFLALPAHAFCPICTIAVGAGIGLSRYFGVDDTITGVWVGGLIVSMAFWTDNWLISHKRQIKHQNILLLAAYYLIVLVPLYWEGVIGHPLNTLFGIDKLIVGVIFGSLGFWFGHELHPHLKKTNNDKVYFPFQKVAASILPLIILSVVFYFITK